MVAVGLAQTACTVVVGDGSGPRTVYVFGFARVRVPAQSGAQGGTTAYEISGVGIAAGRLVQLGYFKEFEVNLRPDGNSAVIVVRNQQQLEQLERLLKQLNEKGLCIVSKS